MIAVKKRFNGKWQLELTSEVWEFDSVSELKAVLMDMINWKNAFGNIKQSKEGVDDGRQG